jgi:hypothetical protein
MGDPIRTKQALKIGVEATAGANSTVTMSATVDNENRSSNPYTLSVCNPVAKQCFANNRLV